MSIYTYIYVHEITISFINPLGTFHDPNFVCVARPRPVSSGCASAHGATRGPAGDHSYRCDERICKVFTLANT